MAMCDLTQQRALELLNYDPETGVLTWRVRKAIRTAPGSVAGTVNAEGYRRVEIDGRAYAAHQLAWFMTHGAWGRPLLDHINGDRLDNRLCNLRVADNFLNHQNRRKGWRNSVSGMLGVDYVARGKSRWRARILVDGKSIYLGRYGTAEEAHAAYLEAKRRMHVGCTI